MTPELPVREMLGDLLLEMGEPGQAAKAYEAVLAVAPNRFGSLLGAARAAKQMQDTAKARSFYSQLAAICDHADGERAELQEARRFLRAK